MLFTLFHALLLVQAQSPEVKATRVDTPPTIDGSLDDLAWTLAEPVLGLTQVEPVEGAETARATEAYVLYDDTHIYFGFRMEEPEVGEIVRQEMRRDAYLRADDRIEWILDTFNDNRTAYFFQMSAAGSRGDGLISDNGFRFNKRWDGWWSGESRIGSDEWTVEAAIPFASLAFGPDSEWGFNIQRYRGTDRTTDRWAGYSRSFNLFTVSRAGSLSGLNGMQQGLGLEFKPYYKTKTNRDSTLDTTWRDDRFGGDLNWRITPTSTAAFTWQTDFAETEIDDVQVNLTRYSLFYPEKRDFFLEDATLFEFGPMTKHGGTPDVLAFHSRRVGLTSAGQEVPLEGGVRFGTHEGPFNLGLLAIRTEELPGAGLAAADLLVARPSMWLAKGLAVGAIFTSGDPYNEESASTVGADVRYQTTKLFNGTFGVNAYAMQAVEQSSSSRDRAYGLQAQLRTDDWTFALEELTVGDEFVPTLGFVQRQGQRLHGARVTREFRPQSGSVREYTVSVGPEMWTDLSNERISYRVGTKLLGVEWESGDTLRLSVIPEGDRVEAPNNLIGGLIPIAPGEHDWVQGRLAFNTATRRPLSANASVSAGDWYDQGSLETMTVGVGWRPSERLRLDWSHTTQTAELPALDFDITTDRLKFDWVVSPSLSWESVAQSLVQSFAGPLAPNTIGLQSRLRWIHEDGKELHFVLESGWQEIGPRYETTTSGFTAKLVWAFRF